MMYAEFKMLHIKMLLVKDIQKLEYDAQAQYHFNLYCAWFFLIQMPIAVALLIWLNSLWIIISIAYLAELSIWALVATHFGNMSAVLARENISHCPGCNCPKPMPSLSKLDRDIVDTPS